MARHRTLALVAMAYFLVVPAIPARAGGQLPDIRGLSFVDPFQGVEFFAGDGRRLRLPHLPTDRPDRSHNV